MNICLLPIALLINGSASKVLKPKSRDTSQSAAHSLIGTAFDYDYLAPLARRAPSRYQKSTPTTTTERPFIRYWNNFVRNIRVPVPSITWNVTNPLVNLFSAGVTNVIDTPVGNYNHRTTKRKRSKSTKPKNAKRRKHTPTHYDEDETNQPITYDGYTMDFDPRETMYFYDARTGQYYKMQTQYVNSYTFADQQVQQLQQQPSDDEQEMQEADDDEIDATQEHDAMVDAQIESPTAGSNESDNETGQHADDEDVVADAEEIKDDSGEVELIPADVENFDDSVEEQTSHKQQLAGQTKSNKPKKIKAAEELRNAIGTYMRDDHFNRMRQRAQTKQSPQTLRSKLKTQPRKKLIYYILQPM